MAPRNAPRAKDPFTTIGFAKALQCACQNAQRFTSKAGQGEFVMGCVAIDADDQRVRFVSTDSRQLLVQELVVAEQGTLDEHETGVGEWSALIHGDDLDLVIALVKDVKTTPVDLIRTGDGLVVRVGEREVICPQYVDADFPDWERLITPDLFQDGDAGTVSKMAFASGTLSRVGALSLPTIKKKDITLAWSFVANDQPVSFSVTNVDAYLTLHGFVAPARPKVGEEQEQDA